MKEQIIQLIGQGELERALAATEEWVRQTQALQHLGDITLLSGRLQAAERQELRDTQSPEALQRERNQIAESMLELLERLPDAPPAPAKKKGGIRERALKQHILFLLIGIKAVVLGWLYTHWESGGFSMDQFTGALTLLVPVLVTYAGLMFQDFLDNRHVSEGKDENSPLVKRSVQLTIYAIMLAYGIILISLIGMKARGTVSFAQMAAFFTLAESFIGVYLGRIVKTFFGVKGEG